MKIDFCFFNFSSIKIEKMPKYNDKILIFDNHFKDLKKVEKGFQIFAKTILEIEKESENKIIEWCYKKKHWSLKDTNSEVEPVLLVLMGYGYSRDFIINHIFDGYNSENLSSNENMVQEKFLTRAKIIKMPLEIGFPKKERLIAIIKDNKFFPLFVDINHSLYYNNPKEVASKLKIESLFMDFLIKKYKS